MRPTDGTACGYVARQKSREAADRGRGFSGLVVTASRANLVLRRRVLDRHCACVGEVVVDCDCFAQKRRVDVENGFETDDSAVFTKEAENTKKPIIIISPTAQSIPRFLDNKNPENSFNLVSSANYRRHHVRKTQQKTDRRSPDPFHF